MRPEPSSSNVPFCRAAGARGVRLESLRAELIVGGRAPTAQPGPATMREAIGHPRRLPNLHSHAFQRAMAGLTERRGPGQDNFWSWRDVMYRFAGRMGPDDVQAIAAYAYADMAEAGFTAVGEFHYVHRAPDGSLYGDPAEMALRHLAAAETAGIGITLLPVFYAASGFGGAPPTSGQKRFITDIEVFGRIVGNLRAASAGRPGRKLGVAAHSLRAVPPDLLKRDRWPLSSDGPMHIHIAEQVKEVEDCLAWSGLRPVEWLIENIGLDPRWCLVHATHMTPEETTRAWPRPARWPGCARSPRPTSATASSPPRPISKRAAGSASAAIPMSRSTRRASFACSNTASGCCTARAMCWPRPSQISTGNRGCSRAPWRAGPRPWAMADRGPCGRRRGPISSSWNADHPDLASASRGGLARHLDLLDRPAGDTQGGGRRPGDGGGREEGTTGRAPP